ncbi:MAG: response regulator [bacterium]|nr:response regulator [bacterium]
MTNKKILIVDDDTALLTLFQMVLGAEYEVITAASGTTAMRKASENLELALIDYNMPGINGINLAEKLHFRFPNLKIMIMSGVWHIEKEVSNTSAIGFIRKPCMDFDDILNKILQVTNPAVLAGAR